MLKHCHGAWHFPAGLVLFFITFVSFRLSQFPLWRLLFVLFALPLNVTDVQCAFMHIIAPITSPFLLLNRTLYMYHLLFAHELWFVHPFFSQALHFPYRIPATRRKPRKRQSPKLRYTHFVNISGIWFHYIEKWQWQWLRIHEYDYYNWLSWGCWNVMKLFSCIIYCECDLSVSLIAIRWIVGLRSHFFHNEICNSFMECNLYERILMFTND